MCFSSPMVVWMWMQVRPLICNFVVNCISLSLNERAFHELLSRLFNSRPLAVSAFMTHIPYAQTSSIHRYHTHSFKLARAVFSRWLVLTPMTTLPSVCESEQVAARALGYTDASWDNLSGAELQPWSSVIHQVLGSRKRQNQYISSNRGLWAYPASERRCLPPPPVIVG